MNQAVGIRFNGRGHSRFFSPAGHSPVPGDRVIVETEQGVSIGTVVSVNVWGGALPPPSSFELPESEAPPAAEPSAGRDGEEPDELLNSPPEDGAFESLAIGGGQSAAEDLDEAALAVGVNASAEREGRALPPILRLATEADLAAALENESLAKEALDFCRRCIHERGLDMKLVDVEVFFDRSKIVFYFTAPARIDFRDLVKDLVHSYRTRIELRQIGVRHETQMIGGLGNCGMVCCCRRYLRKFAPVTIKMAKEQNLFLNPAKISGICGRLLCCLSYEQENFEAFHNSCPRLGKRYRTGRGIVRVLRSNMFRNSVMVVTETGEEQEITLPEWEELAPVRVEQPQPSEAGRPQNQDAAGGGVSGGRQARPEGRTPARPAPSGPAPSGPASSDSPGISEDAGDNPADLIEKNEAGGVGIFGLRPSVGARPVPGPDRRGEQRQNPASPADRRPGDQGRRRRRPNGGAQAGSRAEAGSGEPGDNQ